MGRILSLASLTIVCLAVSCSSGSSGSSGGGGGGGPPGPETVPSEFTYLEPGFSAELVAGSLNMPVKMVQTPDGRILFTELGGQIRVIDVDGTLLTTPFATITVVTGGERGLLGIALSPGYNTNGYVYVVACVSGPDRQQVIRFTDVSSVGTNQTVVVDNLPIGTIHNGGDIEFMNDGAMVISIGDTGDSALAQDDLSLAGRILRYNETGTIPISNPISGSPEWCRGLRNTFDMTVHPGTNGLFGVENGPTTDDELNFLFPGKNFEWETLPPSWPSSEIGVRLYNWFVVIAPTGLTFHSGTMFGSTYQNDLFVTSYVDQQVLWMQMSGAQHTDVDAVTRFAELEVTGTDNIPLGIMEAQDGSLYFSTFTAIWRIYQ